MTKKEITLPGLNEKVDEMVLTTNDRIDSNLEECASLLFPQKGETTPRLRFKGFEGEWNEVTFGNIFKYERPDNYIVKSEAYADEYPTPVLTANKGFILGYTNESRTYNAECVIFDDFTLDCKFVNFPFMVKSSAMKILTIKDETKYDLFFAYCLLSSTKIEILGHARHYISVVQPTKVKVPSLKEQKKIASFFRHLDEQIAIQQQQLDRLKQMKQACLNSLFTDNQSITPPPFEI